MKIEDRTNEKKMFASLKVGDVFKYANNFYLKIDPIYPINPINDAAEVEDYIENSVPVNAYNLLLNEYDTIGNMEEIQVVKATLVIE